MRNILILFALLSLLACSTSSPKHKNTHPNSVFQEELQEKLKKMVQADTDMMNYYSQNLQVIPVNTLNQKRDSIFRSNGEMAKEIFGTYGFPGYDVVGETGTRNFWLIVQHSDYDPVFQEQVLKAMKLEVEQKNAHSSNYAFLVDRVRKNKGQKQLYGTQITHDAQMWAIPEPLEDSMSVNQRRASIGLASIESYLNDYMQMHFEMNPAYYQKQGISKPFAYVQK